MPSHTFTRARLLAGLDRHQHRVRRGRQARAARSPKSCTRWTTASTPTCRRRRIARRGNCSSRCPRSRARFDPDAIGSAAPGLRRRVRAGGDPGALRAGTRRVGRRREARGASRQVPVHRSADLVRARARRRAHRRRRDRSVLNRGAAADPAAAVDRKRGLLGRADRASSGGPRRRGSRSRKVATRMR